VIQFNCPHCDAELEAADKSAGGKMACPDCGKKMLVPEAEEPPAKKSAPPPTKKPAANLTSKKPGGVAASKPAAKSRPRRDEDDDFDDDEDARPSPKKQGSSKGLWIGLGVGGGVAAIAAVLIAVMMSKGDKPDTKTNVADNQPPKTFTPPPNITPPTGTNGAQTTKSTDDGTKKSSATTTTPPVEKSAETATGAVGPRVADGQKIYQRLLKSTVLVITPIAGGYSKGSGSLIDVKNRIVVTNHHVVAGGVGKAQRQTYMFFPIYQDGKLLADFSVFQQKTQNGEDALLGDVLITEPKVDLALVQLKKLPPDARALPIGNVQPKVGSTIYSCGHPGASQGLWIYTQGHVRQLFPKRKFATGGGHGPNDVMQMEADMIMVDSPVNQGDSGGPMVNDRAELVCVVQSKSAGGLAGDLLNSAVDVSELRALLDRYSASSGMKFSLETGAGIDAGDEGDIAGLIKLLGDKDAARRANAARALGEMGSGAKPAIIYLINALKDTDEFVKRTASKALDQIGTPDKVDAPKLGEALKDSSVEVRTYAADALGRMGHDAKAALPALVAASKDPDVNLRQAAVRSLGRVGADNKEAVLPVLTEVFGDSDRDVRLSGAEAMGNLTLTAGDLPMLVPMLKHKEIEGRIGAARAIGKIGPEARTAIKPLIDALANANPLLRKAIIDTLATFNADAKDSIPEIEKCLRGGDKEVRRSALVALGNMGVESKTAVPAIADCCKDFDLRKDAMATLVKIGPPAAKDGAAAVAGVLKATNKEDRRIALETLVVLKPTGAEAKEVVSRVIEVFNVDDKDKDKDLFDKAAETVGKIGKPALGQLAVALTNTNHNVRIGAALCLGEIGPDAKTAIITLQQYAARDPNPDVRNACNKALTRIAR
jgi:HEAT repeat protein/S1-C subfamily serine protease